MSNVTKMLKEDHRRVQELFKRFESTEDSRERQQIAAEAIRELEVHSTLEEEIVYPVLQESETEMFHEAHEEHHVADLLINELRGMTPSDPVFAAKFTVLAESVRHHIKEEESQVLPKIDRSGADLDQIEERLVARKQELMAEQQSRAGRQSGRNGQNGRAGRQTGSAGGRRVAGRRGLDLEEGVVAAGPDLSSRLRTQSSRNRRTADDDAGGGSRGSRARSTARGETSDGRSTAGGERGASGRRAGSRGAGRSQSGAGRSSRATAGAGGRSGLRSGKSARGRSGSTTSTRAGTRAGGRSSAAGSKKSGRRKATQTAGGR